MIYNNQKTKKKNEYKWTMIAFVLGVSVYIYSVSFDVIFTKIFGQNAFDTVISYLILSFAIFKSMSSEQGLKNNNYITFSCLKYTAIFYVIYKFSNMVYTKQNYFYNLNTFDLYKNFVFAFISAFIIDREDMLKKSMRYIAYIMYFSMVFIPYVEGSFISIVAENDSFSGYMLYGYRMLPGVIMMFYLYFRDKKPIDFLLAVFGLLELFIYANRGAVVAVVIFIIIYQLICVKSVKRLRNMFLLSLLAICIYFMIQPESLSLISDFLNSIGIKSRNITKLLDGSVSITGREYIYEQVFAELSKGNLTGLGLFGDRILLHGDYPHNFIYEILLQFGWLLGSLILAIFFYALGKILLSHKYESLRAESLVFTTTIMIKLFLSGSYLHEYSFFFLLAYMLNIKRLLVSDTMEKKNDKISDKINL